jgi:hypothetical protein
MAQSVSCAAKRDWIERNKRTVCKKNAQWVGDGICRQTCADLGRKFAYASCASSPAVAEAPSPS